MEAEGHGARGAPFPWRAFFVLWALAVAGTAAVLPYTLTLQGPVLEKAVASKALPLPLPALIAIQVLVQSPVMFGVVTLAGLWLARRVGLGAPVLERWAISREPVAPGLRAIAPRAAAVGVAAGLAIALIDQVAFSAGMREELARAAFPPATVHPPAWQGVLASLYGGVDEELLTRLFLLSLLAWLGSWVTGTRGARPAPVVLWSANVLAALLFGAGHLPAVRAMGLSLDAFLLARTLLLNGVAGIAFGWLYLSVGLEASMIAHLSADLVLHGLVPLLSG